MEIEAKFIVPDEATFARLARLKTLHGYRLAAAQIKHLHDVYLDTVAYDVLRGGYACRLRRKNGTAPLLALKSLSPASGVVHVREELENALHATCGLDYTAWPSSPAVVLLHALARGEPLAPLFELYQQRRVQVLLHPAGHPLIELSLDRVRYAGASGEELGLEAELLAPDARPLLDQLAGELQTTWGLVPQIRTKFEQGLSLACPQLHVPMEVTHEQTGPV